MCMAIMLSALLAGCAGHTAPKGWLPSAYEMRTESYGAWLSVSYTQESFNVISEGELIAIDQDTLYVLENNLLIRIPLNQIMKAKLVAYKSEHGKLSLWTTAGAISSISHGMILVLSMPTWIIAGSLLTASQSNVPIETIPSAKWHRIRKYARFPQGLPAGFELMELRSKPGRYLLRE
jgi:hypothetical protein